LRTLTICLLAGETGWEEICRQTTGRTYLLNLSILHYAFGRTGRATAQEPAPVAQEYARLNCRVQAKKLRIAVSTSSRALANNGAPIILMTIIAAQNEAAMWVSCARALMTARLGRGTWYCRKGRSRSACLEKGGFDPAGDQRAATGMRLLMPEIGGKPSKRASLVRLSIFLMTPQVRGRAGWTPLTVRDGGANWWFMACLPRFDMATSGRWAIIATSGPFPARGRRGVRRSRWQRSGQFYAGDLPVQR